MSQRALLHAFHIRPAVPGDAKEVAAVHVRSWQVGYRGLLSEEYLRGLNEDDRARHYDFDSVSPSQPKTLVATESGVVRGFATISPSQDEDRDRALLSALYVHPDDWGRGIGMALERAALAQLMQLGYRRASLWVLRGNVRAIRFYKSLGWKNAGTSRHADVWGIEVTEDLFVRDLEESFVHLQESRNACLPSR